MRKFFSLIAAVLFAGSMMADSYTITFKDNGSGSSDNSTSLTSTTVTDYVAEGADYVSAVAVSGKVYNGQEGYGLKFGNSSNPGSITLTLAAAVTPTSIVMNASPWSSSEGSGLLQDSVFATKSTGAKGTFADFTYYYDGATEVTTIVVGTSAKRGYVKSVTVNFEGGVTPPPADTYTVAGNDAAIFGEAWNPALTANDMTLTNGIYKWEKAELNLTVGTIEFKVVKNHSWDVASYPAQNYAVSIAEDGEYTLTITFDPTNEAVAAEAVKNEPLADPTNCAEAAEAALSVSANNELYNNGAVYTIEGYVTGIKTAYSDQYHNISFWMADAADGGEVLQAYRAACASEADAPKVGDKVAVTGSLTKYNTTPEFAAGCTYVITEPYIPVEPEINYYVAGSMGVWGPDEAYKLTPSNNGEYEGEFTFAANDEFKVIGYDGTTVTWFPEGMNNNYVITEAGDYKITFNPAGNVEGWYEGFFNVVKKEEPVNLGKKTIAEFLELKNTTDTCILTGVVSNIVNATYGNFDLTDESGKVYVYGLLTPEGESKKFADLNVAEKDTLTVLAIYNEYNGNPQVKNAIFVEVKKAAVGPAQDIEVTLSSITTPGALIWTDAVAEEGWWQIMGANEACDFSISNLNTTEPAGVYTIDDLDADYSYINIYGENDTTAVAFVDGSVTVAVSEEGIVTLNGTLVGSDGNNYIFNLTYKDPVAEKTVNVAIPEWRLVDNYVASNGLFLVSGMEQTSAYVQLSLWMPQGATEIYGDYTEEDFDLQNFGCYVADANGAYRIFSATINVAKAENGRVLVTADLLCYNNTLYHVTTTIGEGINDVEAAQKAVKMIQNGNVVIIKNGVHYNVNGQVIK